MTLDDLIRDPMRVPPLTQQEAQPGLCVLHQRGQWRATIVAVDWPVVTVQYDDDPPATPVTLDASRLVAWWRVQRRPVPCGDVP